MNTPTIDIQRMSAETEMSEGILKYLLGLPLDASFSAATFEEALDAYKTAPEDSDLEIATVLEMMRLYPARVASLASAEEAKTLANSMEQYMPDFDGLLATKWLKLCVTMQDFSDLTENEVVVPGIKINGKELIDTLIAVTKENAQAEDVNTILKSCGDVWITDTTCHDGCKTLVKNAAERFFIKESAIVEEE